MKLRPLNDKIVVKPLEAEETVKGGIIIPDNAKEKPQQAEVVAVGPGKLQDNGTRVAPGVKAGEKILFSKYSGSEFKVDGDELLVLDEGDILAVPVGEVADEEADVEKLFSISERPAIDSVGDVRAEWRRLAAKALRQLEESLPSSVQWARSELFTDGLLEALRTDSQVILGLLDRFGSWDHKRDTKLEALERLIREEHPGQKILVFSEYADTAVYVNAALRAREIDRVDVVTGRSENPTRLAWRFSPQSNRIFGGPPDPSEELEVLVATDVLSEGQNLQDAAIVVNFDLPWAIIKLIQRAGRVDRIGQRAERVLVYTFLPQSGVESVLRLRARVAARLAHNAAVFGADEQFFGTPEEMKVIEGLFDENSEAMEQFEGDDVDYASAAYEIWRRAELDHPALAKQAAELPDVTLATRATSGAEEAGVFVYTLSRFGVDRLGFAPSLGTPVRISPTDALRLTACEPETPPVHRLSDHFRLLDAVLDGPLSPEETSAEGTMTGVRRRVYERVRSLVEDRSDRLFEIDRGAQTAFDALVRLPLTEEAKQQLVRAMRERTNEDLLALIVQLHKEGRLSVDLSIEQDDVHVVCSMGFLADD